MEAVDCDEDTELDSTEVTLAVVVSGVDAEPDSEDVIMAEVISGVLVAGVEACEEHFGQMVDVEVTTTTEGVLETVVMTEVPEV
jgi:hypothetical protein